MNARFTRGLVAAVGAIAVAGAALVAAPVASANGTLSITPTAGSGETAFSVTTTGGCNSANATHYVITLSGGALTETINLAGLQPLSAIPAISTQTTPMTIAVPSTFDMAQESYGSAIPTGVYDVKVVCRAALVFTPISVFTGKVTVRQLAGGVAFEDGAQPVPVEVVTSPKVMGKGQVGATLKVTKGTWSPEPDSIKATWKIGNKTVGTGFSYKVKPGDRGKTVVVTVIAAKKGYVAAAWPKSIRIGR